MVTKRRSNLWTWCALLPLLWALAAPALAQDEEGADPPSRVARLSYLSGHVSFQPAGDDQWAEASLNRPFATGDKVYTDRDSRVEFEIGAAEIRLDQSTTMSLLNLDDSAGQIELTEGTLNLDIRRVFDGQSYEVDTPTLAFVISQPGNYRVDIAPDGNSTMVTVFEGSGDVYGENNASYSVRAGNTYKFNDSALRDYEVLDIPRGDDFDAWCADRNRRYARSASSRFVSEDVIGAADLDDYGGWQEEADYGQVWYPRTVEAGWAPYRSGHWSWIDPWGWTWIDAAPWGFAPFHYGRWAYIHNRWGWCPGVYRARPIYAPAVVGFVGGVGFAIGGAGPVGWFPLGPRDVYVPWYHASRSYFTNVNVHNTRIINNTYITNVYNDYSRGRPISGVNYAYRTNVAAVTAVPRDAFVGARGVAASRVQINEASLRSAQVVSRLGVAPTRASFAPNVGRNVAAPVAAVADRRVIARTAPPPRAVPVASRIQAIERNGARPLAVNQLRQAAPRTAAQPATPAHVQVVGQTERPQPLPARAAAPGATAGNPALGNRGAPVNGAARGAVAAPNAGRAPVTAPNVARPGAPATSAPNPGARTAPNPVQERALPSSRFAPRAGAPAGNAPATNLPNRAGPSPSTPRAPATASPVQRAQPQLPQRSAPQPNAGRTAPAQAPRSTAQPTYQRQAPAPRSAAQPQQAPRSVPQQPTYRAQPQPRAAQPQRIERPAQPQIQRAQPQQVQPRAMPQSQPRAMPQPRQAPQPRPAPQPHVERQQRGNDRDRDGGGHGR